MIKKLTFLGLGALMMSAMAVAAPGADANLRGFAKSAPAIKAEYQVKTEMPANRVVKPAVKTRAADMTALGDVIYSPEGVVRYYYKDELGIILNGNATEPFDLTDGSSMIIFGDNNEVYFQDIISIWYFGSFVKGTLDGSTVTIPLPQTVRYKEEQDLGWNLVVLQKNSTGTYQVCEDITSVSFNYDPDTYDLELVLPFSEDQEEYMLGYIYTDDGSFVGDGDFSMSYKYTTDVNTVPEDVVLEDYALRIDDWGYPVKVGRKDNKIYIRDMTETVSYGTVIGTVTGTLVTIEPNQYIGNFSFYGWIQTQGGYYSGNNFYVQPFTNINLILDPDTKELTWPSQDYILGFILLYDGSPVEFDALQNFRIYPHADWSGVPVNPSMLDTDDSQMATRKIYYFGFNIPCVTANDDLLNYYEYYFRVFVDGELYTFEPDASFNQYTGLQYPMTEVPFYAYNDYDLQMVNYTYRQVGLYDVNPTTLGVQAVYYNDGIMTESDIVTLNVKTGETTIEPSGVESIFSDEIVSEEYFDLNGRKVVKPGKGIYLKRATLSDGNVVSGKVMLK